MLIFDIHLRNILKMKVAIVLLATILCSQAMPDETLYQKWANFQKEFGKSYKSPLEAHKRMMIFKQNLDKIDAHNALYNQGEESWTMGVTSFADWTSEEFMEYVNKFPYEPLKNAKIYKSNLTSFKAPASLDWRDSGAVTEVKNQGQCGGCWSFSTTGCIEGQYALTKNVKVSLSEQNLIDCVGIQYSCQGCNGGTMTGAFLWTAKNGITTESQYPYTARDGTCRGGRGAYTVSDVYSVNPSEDNLKEAIAQIGPISVAIEATNNLQLYNGGVLNDRSCSRQLNHGVLAVGYGTQNGQDYWLIKNSWGAQWGEAGYFKLARNSGDKCGVSTDASFATV